MDVYSVGVPTRAVTIMNHEPQFQSSMKTTSDIIKPLDKYITNNNHISLDKYGHTYAYTMSKSMM